MNDLSGDIVIRIASYGEAHDLLRLALACKRFGAAGDAHKIGGEDGAREWSLMDETARRILLQATKKGDAGVIWGASRDWDVLKKLVAAKKSGDVLAEAEEDLSMNSMNPTIAAALAGGPRIPVAPMAVAAFPDDNDGGGEEEGGQADAAGGFQFPPELWAAVGMAPPRGPPPGFWDVTFVEEDEPPPPPAAECEEEEMMSWMELYRELELVRKCRPLKVNLLDLWGEEEHFEPYLARLKDPQNALTKLSICGPEYDAMGVLSNEMNVMDEWAEPETEYVPPARIEKAFRAMATLPNLQEIVIDPGYYSEDGGDLKSSRLCWLLSPHSKYRTLRVADLNVNDQSDVESLAKAFASSTSIQTLCIDAIHIGYRGVTTVAPLMEAIANLPKLKRLRLTFDAFGHGRATNRYVQESIPILRAVRGVSAKAPRSGRDYPEVSNCTDINARI